jgi:hypothetical protein
MALDFQHALETALAISLFAREVLSEKKGDRCGGKSDTPEDKCPGAGQGKMNAQGVGNAEGGAGHLAKGVAGDIGKKRHEIAGAGQPQAKEGGQ